MKGLIPYIWLVDFFFFHLDHLLYYLVSYVSQDGVHFVFL